MDKVNYIDADRKIKINAFISQSLEMTKERLRKEFKEVGEQAFYERMNRDICFRIWNRETSLWKIKGEILATRSNLLCDE